MKASRFIILAAVIAVVCSLGVGFIGCSNNSSSPTDPIVEDPAPARSDNSKIEDCVHEPVPNELPDAI